MFIIQITITNELIYIMMPCDRFRIIILFPIPAMCQIIILYYSTQTLLCTCVNANIYYSSYFM